MKYTQQITANGLATVYDVLNNKQDEIHTKLYEDALSKYIKTQVNKSLREYVQRCQESGKELTNVYENVYNPADYNYIEEPAIDFYKHSNVIETSKKYPFKRSVISLEPYWNNYQHDLCEGVIKNIYMLKLDDKSFVDAEIIYIDYVRGKVLLESKNTDLTFEADFDYITKYTPISKSLSLKDTFMYKLKNSIYGK